ncbi:hypothetical protein [Gemmatimonas sp.]|uniref:hypothetical protein n=1 Tax=Gemmatimonas sp. TaxID=1962908 RepID=UPI003F706DE7
MRRLSLVATATACAFAVACAEVGTAPDVPAAIELPPFAYPSVVVGDTLRNEAGIATPVRAIVRNSAGDIITGATPTYLYADFLRDTAFLVDATSGMVVARRAVSDGRIAARIGASLQVLRPLIATLRPDTADAAANPSDLILIFPDTGRALAQANTTREMTVRVRSRQTALPTDVNGWLVRYQLLRPANPTNDTSAAVYLVNDNGGASTLDTTSSGVASRRARVRANLFPVAQGSARVIDSVIVQATVTYKGRPVAGSPFRFAAPVIRPASQ